MYVCICNGLNDRRIRAAAAESKGSTAAVYRKLGCAPQCGRCVPTVRDMVRNFTTGLTAEEAPAG